MKLWDDIRNYFYRKRLQDELRQLKAARSITNLQKAKTIGILYDSTDPGNDIAITKFVEELKKQGKAVDILGFIDDTKTERKADIPLFNRKNLTWTRVPTGEPVKKFTSKNFDLLLACFAAENMPLEFIANTSHAKWRVGTYAANKTSCYDMMINLGGRKDLPYLIEQTVHFLNEIKYDSN